MNMVPVIWLITGSAIGLLYGYFFFNQQKQLCHKAQEGSVVVLSAKSGIVRAIIFLCMMGVIFGGVCENILIPCIGMGVGFWGRALYILKRGYL